MRVFTTADEIIEHLALLGTLRSEDNPAFVELDHGLQCAAILERSDPDDVELQIAGLIHDLAHPWDGPGQPRHGIMGADAVRPLLGDRMADLINGHVAAKRYLVATRPEYRSILSADSIMTLEAQGGAMADDEVREFESHPDWEAMVSLRIADDGEWLHSHQDAPAYPFIRTHISCMVAIDDAYEANGCLEAVSGMHHNLIPTDAVGCIPTSVAETLAWRSIPVRAGQVLWFHSRTPHRSGPNNSSTDRRAIYPTYNAASEGDLREAYYAENSPRWRSAPSAPTSRCRLSATSRAVRSRDRTRRRPDYRWVSKSIRRCRIRSTRISSLSRTR